MNYPALKRYQTFVMTDTAVENYEAQLDHKEFGDNAISFYIQLRTGAFHAQVYIEHSERLKFWIVLAVF